jgi:hypothetical protein
MRKSKNSPILGSVSSKQNSVEKSEKNELILMVSNKKKLS